MIMCHITGTIIAHKWLSILSNDTHEIDMDVAPVSNCRVVHAQPSFPVLITKFRVINGYDNQ